MNRTKIDWPDLDYTWNPVVGCRRNCWYCYAEKLHNKRHIAYIKGQLQNCKQYAKPFNEMQFLPERLKVKMPKKPSKIFIGSMSDICYWKGEWITATLNMVEDNPRHMFMFLTKAPKIYSCFKWPMNCQLGMTATNRKEYFDRVLAFKKLAYKFLSIEPLFGNFEDVDFSTFDLIIIGAITGAGTQKPKQEWIESIVHPNIHYKKNILRYMK